MQVIKFNKLLKQLTLKFKTINIGKKIYHLIELNDNTLVDMDKGKL